MSIFEDPSSTVVLVIVECHTYRLLGSLSDEAHEADKPILVSTQLKEQERWDLLRETTAELRMNDVTPFSRRFCLSMRHCASEEIPVLL